MTHPTSTLKTVSPYAPLAMVNDINDWLTSLRESWKGSTPPDNPVEGQFWLDTNTTVGKRLFMRVGSDWQLLLSGVGPFVEDFDTTRKDGFYRFAGGALNSPYPDNVGTLIVSARDGAATQIVMRQTNNEADLLHVRTWLGGSSWTAWRNIFTQADIVGVVRGPAVSRAARHSRAIFSRAAPMRDLPTVRKCAARHGRSPAMIQPGCILSGRSRGRS